MSMRDASHLRTLCEVLREIADIHQGGTIHDSETLKKLAEAERMGKRMSAKLLEYNKEVFAEWWEDNPGYEEDLKRRIDERYISKT